MKKKGQLILLIAVCFGTLSARGAKPNVAEILHRSEGALTSVIVRDIFSPPVASRIYLYSNIAAYEALVPFQSEYKSLSESIKKFPVIKPVVGKAQVNQELAVMYAFFKTAQRFVFSENMLLDSLHKYLLEYKNINVAIYNQSLAYGQMVSDSVVAWAGKDNYKETRKLRRYNFIKQPGKWSPTPPGYMAAVEPYWSKIRTIVLDSASECKPDPATNFSPSPGSQFYKMAYEVYNAGKNMDPQQKAIALFWDCNPFFLNTQGHLNFATKKLSPGGHWISIVGIAARKVKASMIASAACYTLTSIALFDGFVSCWDEKFRSNLIRPETYINAYIDEQWRPLLQTPPFPEYTSGHSVISTAAAEVLTAVFGDHFHFDDITEIPYGLPVRSFNSFKDAANEAAISRFYGGIHYMPAIVNGQQQGMLIGKKVLERVKLK